MVFDQKYHSQPFATRLITGLENSLAPAVEASDKYWGWISYPTDKFLEGLWYLYQKQPGAKFLDVGCGIGTKLALAAMVGFKVTGIEINQEYADMARQLLSELNLEAEIITVDALKFTDYERFDFIYSYRPFKQLEDENKFERSIIELCPEHAHLFLPGSQYPSMHGWKNIYPEIWRRE